MAPHLWNQFDRAALERLERDRDLRELSDRLGCPNIFDALGIERAEIKHSNFLAWLLGSDETHGQGTLFLKAVLKDIQKQARKAGKRFLAPHNWLLENALREARVYREWNSCVDLLIVFPSPKVVVVIEHKFDAREHGRQLSKYRKLVENHFRRHYPWYVFLAKPGTEPSEGRWLKYSYENLHATLQKERTRISNDRGREVGILLDHYLQTIGRVVKNHSNRNEVLVRRIYRNHRRAIDLLLDHKPTPVDEVHKLFRARAAKADLDCEIVEREENITGVVPQSWLRRLPRIGEDTNLDPRSWLRIRLHKDDEGYWLVLCACQVVNKKRRNTIIESILSGSDLEPRRKKWREQDWIMLWRTADPVEHELGREPKPEDIAKCAAKKLKVLLRKLRNVPKSLAQLHSDPKNKRARRIPLRVS